MRRVYGTKWRVLAHRKDGESVAIQDDGCFDELVLEDILHIEQMDTRVWWMRLGDAAVWIHVPARGRPQIAINFGDQADDRIPTPVWTLRGTQEHPA